MRSRKDNNSAVEVGHLRGGQQPFTVVRPKMSDDLSDVLSEGAHDLTLRAKEVDTLKACISVNHIEKMFGNGRWWTQIGTLFPKQFSKELKELGGKSCIIIT